MRYSNLSGYLRERYGRRLKKICIDGGFSCPNRDGKCGTGGCIFCGERGAGEHIAGGESITKQVRRALDGAKEDELFIAYFQNFTNTYAPCEILREKYDSALIDQRIRILAIGTRPDCIDDGVCHLLAEYNEKLEVWVELGLQTASDEVARVINRGYNTEVFDRAVRLLKKYGIKTVVHIIAGLPTDDIRGFMRTVDYVQKTAPFGVKIHSIYVMRGTRLAKMYLEKSYTPPTLDEYTECVAYAISHLPTDVIIHRLTGDCPPGALLAPDWSRDKHALIDEINERLKQESITQGCAIVKDN